MHEKRFLAVAALAAVSVLPVAAWLVPLDAHEGDPKLIDLVPPHAGPGFRSGHSHRMHGRHVSHPLLPDFVPCTVRRNPQR